MGYERAHSTLYVHSSGETNFSLDRDTSGSEPSQSTLSHFRRAQPGIVSRFAKFFMKLREQCSGLSISPSSKPSPEQNVCLSLTSMIFCSTVK